MGHRTHIRANHPWWRIDVKEIWEYRDLLWNLVARDLTASYKQSVFGPLWFVILPVATSLVFTVVFGSIVKIGTDGLPPFLFYMSGLLFWNYFQGCLNGVASSLVSNAGVLTKVYFPRLIIPLSLVVSNMVQLALSSFLLACFYAYFVFFGAAHVHATMWAFALPFCLLYCVLLGLGTGLWFSSLTVKYRDLRFLLPLIAQLWMYGTPIVYPMSSVVKTSWYWLVVLNPMTLVVEVTRKSLLGVGTVTVEMLLTGVVLTLLVSITGLIFFNKVQRTFADTI
jgi:lipopolysaccharide transport system permease protein